MNKQICMLIGYRSTIYHVSLKDSQGRALKVRVNGKCKTWKTRENEFKLPVKYGLYKHFYIDQDNCHEWSETE